MLECCKDGIGFNTWLIYGLQWKFWKREENICTKLLVVPNK